MRAVSMRYSFIADRPSSRWTSSRDSPACSRYRSSAAAKGRRGTVGVFRAANENLADLGQTFDGLACSSVELGRYC